MRKGREEKSWILVAKKLRNRKSKIPARPRLRFPDLPPIPTSNRQCLTHATLSPTHKAIEHDAPTNIERANIRTHLHNAPPFLLSARCRPLIRIALNAVLPFRISSKNRAFANDTPDFARFFTSAVIKTPYFVLNHKQIILFYFQSILFYRERSNKLSHSGYFDSCE